MIFFVFTLMAEALFFSCGSGPHERGEQPPVPERPSVPEPPPVPERPPVPSTPELIMGQGKVSTGHLARFLEGNNPGADTVFTGSLAAYYVEEAAAEGVNHDVAFAQMCLETGFLRYGGLVSPGMNNFCGLGSTGPGNPGEIFPEPRIGVRAHIQHLKAYATESPLNQTLVDPRYRWVRYGSSPKIEGLAGTWAADRAYGSKIRAILERLYLSAFGDIALH